MSLVQESNIKQLPIGQYITMEVFAGVEKKTKKNTLNISLMGDIGISKPDLSDIQSGQRRCGDDSEEHGIKLRTMFYPTCKTRMSRRSFKT